MPAAYVPNPGFEKEFAEQNPGFLQAAGEKIAAAANPITPRIMPSGPGEAVQVETIAGQVWVVNRDFGGHLAEFGSVNNAASMPLRRAVRECGYSLSEI